MFLCPFVFNKNEVSQPEPARNIPLYSDWLAGVCVCKHVIGLFIFFFLLGNFHLNSVGIYNDPELGHKLKLDYLPIKFAPRTSSVSVLFYFQMI